MPEMLTEAWIYLLGLPGVILLRLFWFYIIFDLPRFVVTDLAIFILEIRQRNKNSVDLDFQRRLREDPPLVSIIVPVLNEEETIEWTIRSLREQTYRNLELIVVDDGSDDRTPQICARLAKQFADFRHLRFVERAGKSAALNYGLKYATGEFIVFVDADTTFDRHAVFEIISGFADPRVGGVSGNLSLRNAGANVLTRLQQIEYLFTISMGRRLRSRMGILPIISGAFGAFRREIALENLGGHEPGPGNDSDLAIRVRKKGYKIKFQPRAYCYTNAPTALFTLIKQRSRWDRNMIKNRVRKHRDVFNPFSKNFRLVDVVTFVDSLFYHVALALITVFYLTDIAWHYPDYFTVLVTINFILYFTTEFIELVVVLLLDGRERDLPVLLLYLPLVNFFKIFLKFVRVAAYLQEFLTRASNRDPFAPLKVRTRYIQW